MIFQDNVVKEYLKNVYFVTGTPCGGKTTISRELGKRHNLPVYDVDEKFSEHQRISNPIYQPAMNKKFKNADEFFGRTIEDYAKWLLKNTREQLDYILMDLIQLSHNQIVICDLDLAVDEANLITDYERIVFLIKNPTNIIDDYCNRADHNDFNNFINSAANPKAAKMNCNNTLEYLNYSKYKQIKESHYFWLERDRSSMVEDTVRRVEQHFHL